jgi:hypothetical protein
MQLSDIVGIRKRGQLDRATGLGYFDNPHLMTTAPMDTMDQWDEWSAICHAWWDGWLAEDAGRTLNIQRLLAIRYW